MRKIIIIHLLVLMKSLYCQDTCGCNVVFKNFFDKDTLNSFEYELEIEGKEINFANKPFVIKNNDEIMEIFLFSCKGKALIKIFDKQKKIKRVMKFIDGLEVLKKYIFIDPLGIDSDYSNTIQVQNFYQAIPNGDWIYYDYNLNIEKTEIYKYGIIVKSFIIKK